MERDREMRLIIGERTYWDHAKIEGVILENQSEQSLSVLGLKQECQLQPTNS